ncbi:MAG: Glu-tRNA(Gln) amidotransferase subunit GatD [Methanospirillum sp.]|uniref:Glu-tRNA(Gln) amidotransferase subunit GatD n=1 Tax=Methanospirillum sp. TaxID=45200 RepID=UPI0023720DAB|nr:Glu-tRNA(Gln) amidotransferase subunit GatD [Methanospirillum sp.]MDD1729547.1 Glu-tRNA(Gln) amidotransferase subunit GatD [Methanospirillum sp.]
MSTQESAFETGDQVRCTVGAAQAEGSFITSRDGMAVIKLGSGYNIGVPFGDCSFISRPGTQEAPEPAEVTQNQQLPPVTIVSTGGTIASRIDYRTGAVTSQFRATDILHAIPGLSSIARFRAIQLCNILSENMTPVIWQQLARAIHDEIKDGATGIIVTHGTDTMAYSAAAVSFMVQTPVPIVFVGSQRSADRPSSDNLMNGLCAAKAAVSDLGEVVVVMHANTSDDACAIHRGTRVRKMHTSRRDAFQSHGLLPIGTVSYPDLSVSLTDDAILRGSRTLALADRLEERCGLIYYYPGMDPEILSAYTGYKGIILAGTGLGHVSSRFIQRLANLINNGVIVVMTSQCLHGRVCDRVYDTGRDLLSCGVIEGEDMLPEVALVKLMWVLGNASSPENAREMLTQNLVGEIDRRSLQ